MWAISKVKIISFGDEYIPDYQPANVLTEVVPATRDLLNYCSSELYREVEIADYSGCNCREAYDTGSTVFEILDLDTLEKRIIRYKDLKNYELLKDKEGVYISVYEEAVKLYNACSCISFENKQNYRGDYNYSAFSIHYGTYDYIYPRNFDNRYLVETIDGVHAFIGNFLIQTIYYSDAQLVGDEYEVMMHGSVESVYFKFKVTDLNVFSQIYARVRFERSI